MRQIRKLKKFNKELNFEGLDKNQFFLYIRPEKAIYFSPMLRMGDI